MHLIRSSINGQCKKSKKDKRVEEFAKTKQRLRRMGRKMSRVNETAVSIKNLINKARC
jgi:hypothetical protein